ncbi:MAG: carbonic anhydrase [Candidatus Eremiobacteraeota bacterium]|nr:carbonic anhydrase [Candidatus Eremiobacteraeota bacterium]MBV8366440.1 carbonic anhydrase [Candidatus Eremiobacteraeota bacterium]
MTPARVLGALKRGNDRFRAKQRLVRTYIARGRPTATEQHPSAVILGCIDSRVPAEIVFGLGIGDAFIVRIAGNVVNDDVLGSLEFACAVAGAQVVVVLGHTGCGAIQGAIAGVKLGKLTALLAQIKAAITATAFTGERSSSDAAYVDAVAQTNVMLMVESVRRRSRILAELEKKGGLVIAGAMYDLKTGKVTFAGARDS